MYLDALFSFSSFLIIVEHSIMNQMSWKHMNEVFLFNFAYAYEMREYFGVHSIVSCSEHSHCSRIVAILDKVSTPPALTAFSIRCVNVDPGGRHPRTSPSSSLASSPLHPA